MLQLCHLLADHITNKYISAGLVPHSYRVTFRVHIRVKVSVRLGLGRMILIFKYWVRVTVGIAAFEVRVKEHRGRCTGAGSNTEVKA